MLALQCGEPGPFAQAIAGIDLALWDLMRGAASCRCGSCSAAMRSRIRVYASGINPTGSRQMAEAAREHAGIAR